MSGTNADCCLMTSRRIPADRGRILEAFRDPSKLCRWWGPEGFRNTFHEFEFRPGGMWRFDMHGPDGVDYPNECRFDVIGEEGVVLTHLATMHRFELAITLEPAGEATHLTWKMTFETKEECDKVRAYAPACNEQNLDRLEAVLRES